MICTVVFLAPHSVQYIIFGRSWESPEPDKHSNESLLLYNSSVPFSDEGNQQVFASCQQVEGNLPSSSCDDLQKIENNTTATQIQLTIRVASTDWGTYVCAIYSALTPLLMRKGSEINHVIRYPEQPPYYSADYSLTETPQNQCEMKLQKNLTQDVAVLGCSLVAHILAFSREFCINASCTLWSGNAVNYRYPKCFIRKCITLPNSTIIDRSQIRFSGEYGPYEVFMLNISSTTEDFNNAHSSSTTPVSDKKQTHLKFSFSSSPGANDMSRTYLKFFCYFIFFLFIFFRSI